MTKQEVEERQVVHSDMSIDRQASGESDVVRETRPISGENSGVGDVEILRSSKAIRAEKRTELLNRYGGLHWGVDLIGFAVATFFTILFLGIVGAVVGAVGYQINAPVPKVGHAVTGASVNLGIGALIASLLAVLLAYFIGGYTAGRMMRFHGARQGLGVVAWTEIAAVILGIAGGILGSKFNVASQLHLNIDRTTMTAGGAISLFIALAVILLAATLGGSMGERYHAAIDRDAGLAR